MKTLESVMGHRQTFLFDKSVGLARSSSRAHCFLELAISTIIRLIYPMIFKTLDAFLQESHLRQNQRMPVCSTDSTLLSIIAKTSYITKLAFPLFFLLYYSMMVKHNHNHKHNITLPFLCKFI